MATDKKYVSKWYRWKVQGSPEWAYEEELVWKEMWLWKQPRETRVKLLVRNLREQYTLPENASIILEFVKPSKVPLWALQQNMRFIKDSIKALVNKYNAHKRLSEKYFTQSGVVLLEGDAAKKRLVLEEKWTTDFDGT